MSAVSLVFQYLRVYTEGGLTLACTKAIRLETTGDNTLVEPDLDSFNRLQHRNKVPSVSQ